MVANKKELTTILDLLLEYKAKNNWKESRESTRNQNHNVLLRGHNIQEREIVEKIEE